MDNIESYILSFIYNKLFTMDASFSNKQKFKKSSLKKMILR